MRFGDRDFRIWCASVVYVTATLKLSRLVVKMSNVETLRLIEDTQIRRLQFVGDRLSENVTKTRTQ